MHTLTCITVHTCVAVNMYKLKYTCTCTYAYTCVYMHVYTCTYMNMYIMLQCTYTLYGCIYIYAYSVQVHQYVQLLVNVHTVIVYMFPA